MRKIKRRKLKKQKHILAITLVTIIICLTVGYAAFQTTISLSVKGHIVIDERCVNGNVFNFEQKDEIQEFKVPCSGTYKLETWGAQGGNAKTLEGGYGGYSIGNIDLKVKQKLYVIVGGKGESTLELEDKENIYYKRIVGGYNGGGNGTSGQCSTIRLGAGGGGATHIANKTGLLTNFYNDLSNLYIVSGGGGGAFSFDNMQYGAYGAGASSGGQIGNTAYFTLISHTKTYYATGGNQYISGTSGNSYGNDLISNFVNASFGKGGDYNATYGCSNGSGGGAGYYGGGAAAFAPGAGGSSYISNSSLTDKSMYCYDCEESLDLTKPEIFTVSTTGDSNYKDTLNCPNGYSENPVSKCAKKGDGYARITLISKK